MIHHLNILIVEDDPIIGQQIEHFLIQFGHHVIDIVHNSEKALDLIYSQQPDLVLLDINIDGTKDGVQIAQVIEDKYSIPYIFLSALSDEETLKRAQGTKPIGYVVKPFKASDLFVAISIGMSNYQKSLKREISQEIVNNVALSPLSKKEYTVLQDIAKGLTNEQIARQLEVSKNTIKWHTQNIFSKLGVPNRTAATKLMMSL